jgi:two-component system cell cycle sensor histidine kinase/response regulator CckA
MNDKRMRAAFAARIALLYLLFAGAWIILSDGLLYWLVSDAALASRLQTYKGGAFVLVTAALLFFIMRSRIRALVETHAALSEAEFHKVQLAGRFRRGMENIPDVIAIFDTDLRIRYINAAAQRITGRPPAEFIGKTQEQLWPPEVYQEYLPFLEQALHTRSIRFLETELQLPEIGLRSFKITCVPLFDDAGSVLELLAVAHDFTDEKQREREYKELLYGMNDSAFVIDFEGRFIEISDTAADRLGYSREELLAMGPADIDPHLSWEQIQQLIAGMRKGERQVFETMHKGKSGDVFPVEISSSLVTYRGNPVILSVARDITERKRAEEVLRKRERELSIIIDNMPGLVSHVDRDLRYVYASKGYERMFGVPPQQVVGRRMPEVVGEEVFGQAEPHVQKALSGEQVTVETPIRLPDGELSYGLTTFVPDIDANGEVGGLFIIGLDISELRRAEAERERLLSAIDQAAETIVITDAEGTIQYVNPAFQRITGYSRAEARGQNMRFLKSGKQDDSFYRQMWETIASGNTWQGTIVNRRKDGTLFTEVAAISPVHDAAGNIVSYVAAKRDITQELELEQQYRQAQKMEAVGRLAGGIAHDFNNMLGVILGRAEFALTMLEPSHPLKESLEEILRAAERSADLTRQLLAFARKQTIAPKVLDLNLAVEGTLRMLRRLVGEEIDLQWLPAADLWEVEMDPVQIDQILANLCVNSREAIEGVGRITIQTGNVVLEDAYCRAHPGVDPGQYVMLAVSDDGRGMDEETQAHLFEPFFTTRKGGEGSGLGLATVFGIVKQNSGFIDVYSEPQHGATFEIYLARSKKSGRRAMEKAPKPPLPRGTETILLVEDEPAIMKMGKIMLEELGYTVLTAGTPGEAIRLADEHSGKIQLLITDVVMPEMNGRELAKKLKGLYPNLKRLFMSGYAERGIVRHGVLDEGIHFIQKPFTMNALAETVREVLES